MMLLPGALLNRLQLREGFLDFDCCYSIPALENADGVGMAARLN